MHCTTMFPSRIDIERKMIARTWQTRWAAFQLVRERERERDGETRAGYFKVASLQRWPLNVVVCCLWSTLGPEIVYLSLREKPPFCIPRDPLAVTTCFSLFPRNLFTVITYSRDWGSLHCCPRHYPTLFNRPHSFRGNFPRDLCTRLTSSNPRSFPG